MPGMNFSSGSHPFGSGGMHVYLIAGLFILVAITLLALVYLTTDPRGNSAARDLSTATPAEIPQSIQSRINMIGRSFGTLWVIDGILQLRNAMPSQFVTSIIKPAFTQAPPPLQTIAHLAETLWKIDPVKADLGSAFLQLIIGVGLLVLKPAKAWRIIVKLSILWSLAIFIVGNGFGIFYQGASFATGAPSAILIYLFASIELLKLEKDRSLTNSTRRTGRFLGAYILLGTLLSTLPIEGFWKPGGYYQMIKDMAISKQPQFIATLLNDGADLIKTTGPYINATLIIASVVVATLLYYSPTKRATLVALALITTTAWIFVQDFGVFSATGTDFNSGLPIILLALPLVSKGRRDTTASDQHGSNDAYKTATVV